MKEDLIIKAIEKSMENQHFVHVIYKGQEITFDFYYWEQARDFMNLLPAKAEATYYKK